MIHHSIFRTALNHHNDSNFQTSPDCYTLPFSHVNHNDLQIQTSFCYCNLSFPTCPNNCFCINLVHSPNNHMHHHTHHRNYRRRIPPPTLLQNHPDHYNPLHHMDLNGIYYDYLNLILMMD